MGSYFRLCRAQCINHSDCMGPTSGSLWPNRINHRLREAKGINHRLWEAKGINHRLWEAKGINHRLWETKGINHQMWEAQRLITGFGRPRGLITGCGRPRGLTTGFGRPRGLITGCGRHVRCTCCLCLLSWRPLPFGEEGGSKSDSVPGLWTVAAVGKGSLRPTNYCAYARGGTLLAI